MSQAVTLNIIGAGKLGQQWAYCLKQQSLISDLHVCNSNLESSKEVIAQIGFGTAVAGISELPAANVTWIATTDDRLNDVADQLACCKQLQPQSLVLHSSGVLSARVLNATKIQGCHIASLHPMQSYAQFHTQTDFINSVYCALEGDDSATAAIQSWLAPLQLRWLNINSDKKAAYHAAGVFASNYLISTAHAACQQLCDAGIESKQAIAVIVQLMQGTLNNIKQNQCLKSSLTGPLQRGDLDTLEQHLEALPNDEQRQLYAALGRNIIELTHHNEDFKAQINALLQGYC